jgi:hypothetical protein
LNAFRKPQGYQRAFNEIWWVLLVNAKGLPFSGTLIRVALAP